MSKGRNRDLARRSPTQSLDHTASDPDSGRQATVRYPLMRTVLGDTAPTRVAPRKPPASFVRVRSPTVAVRSSARSYGVKAKSPFLNATLLTPEITERAMVCARRHIRKEVLHALKKTGKGSGGGKRRPRSKWRC